MAETKAPPASGELTLTFDETDRLAFARLNRVLQRTPRVRLTGRRRALIQALIRLRSLSANRRLRALNITVDQRVVEAAGHSVRVRILRAPGPIRGVHLDIHGGGWTTGVAALDDPLNAMIAKVCEVAVVSVDYRLALRVRLPDVITDCETAALWVLRQQEFADMPMTIGGESAGAHLAATALLRLRDRGEARRVAGALLFYGCFDLGGTPSARAAGPETLILHAPTLPDLLPAVTGLNDPEALRDPALSPLYANLSGLPPALIIIGTNDPLRDDSYLLHDKWQAQSGNALLVNVPDAPHAFNRLGGDAAARTNAYARAWLKARLAEKWAAQEAAPNRS